MHAAVRHSVETPAARIIAAFLPPVWASPPNGSRLSCGQTRPAAQTADERYAMLARAQTLRFLDSRAARQLHALVRRPLRTPDHSTRPALALRTMSALVEGGWGESGTPRLDALPRCPIPR